MERATSRALSTSLWGMTAMAVVSRFPEIGMVCFLKRLIFSLFGFYQLRQPKSGLQSYPTFFLCLVALHQVMS
jgi:hypothetical protein